MNKMTCFLVANCMLGQALLQAEPYGSVIIDYKPGSLPASMSTYTNASAALGEPSRVTPGQWGGPVDPFSPPYLNSQLVSVGTNGSITIQMGFPVTNDPQHLYGIDFAVFGNAGFVITNGNYTGGGITDGATFGHNDGQTVVSVSADNLAYYTLDTKKAAQADGIIPMDGSGDFTRPTNPQLSSSDFAGKDLTGIRQLLNGSGGGTGYDISWALDAQGNPANLNSINYVRIDVLSGHAEIDGIAAMASVPEPGTGALLLLGISGFLMFSLRRNSLK